MNHGAQLAARWHGCSMWIVALFPTSASRVRLARSSAIRVCDRECSVVNAANRDCTVRPIRVQGAHPVASSEFSLAARRLASQEKTCCSVAETPAWRNFFCLCGTRRGGDHRVFAKKATEGSKSEISCSPFAPCLCGRSLPGAKPTTEFCASVSRAGARASAIRAKKLAYPDRAFQ